MFASFSVDQGVKTYKNIMAEDFNSSVYEKNLLILGEDSDLKAVCCRKEGSYTKVCKLHLSRQCGFICCYLDDFSSFTSSRISILSWCRF